MPPPEYSRRFSLFGIGESSNKQDPKSSIDRKLQELSPSLKLETDKNVYRPGNEVLITITIQNPNDPSNSHEITSSSERSLLVERLSFELQGVEKLDTQWFTTQKPLPGTKLRKGLYFYFILIGDLCFSRLMAFFMSLIFLSSNYVCACSQIDCLI